MWRAQRSMTGPDVGETGSERALTEQRRATWERSPGRRGVRGHARCLWHGWPRRAGWDLPDQRTVAAVGFIVVPPQPHQRDAQDDLARPCGPAHAPRPPRCLPESSRPARPRRGPAPDRARPPPPGCAPGPDPRRRPSGRKLPRSPPVRNFSQFCATLGPIWPSSKSSRRRSAASISGLSRNGLPSLSRRRPRRRDRAFRQIVAQPARAIVIHYLSLTPRPGVARQRPPASAIPCPPAMPSWRRWSSSSIIRRRADRPAEVIS